MARLAPILGEHTTKSNSLAQQRFSYTCTMIKSEILKPVEDYILDEVGTPNLEALRGLHSIKMDPIQRQTDALYDLLAQEENIDRTKMRQLIQKSAQQEVELMEHSEQEADMIFFFRVLQLLDTMLENAKGHHEFIQVDDIYINTPLRLAKFVGNFLLSRQNCLPEKLPVFKILENIVQRAKDYDPKNM